MVGGLVMTTAELQEQGAIYFDKITEGFRNYKDIKLVMDETSCRGRTAKTERG